MIKISYSSFFFTFKNSQRERRNIHKSDITRNQNGGKGPSITTTLELIYSRKLVTYLYLDTQSTSPFPPFLPFLPSFLRSFLFVDHGRDQRKSPLKGEPSVVAKPLERNHRWRSARICETSLAIFLDLFCPRSKINKPLSILLFPIVSLLDQIVSFLSIDRTDSFVPIKVRLLEDRLKRDERGS